MLRTSFLSVCYVLLLWSCDDLIQYSPNAIDFDDDQRDLNNKNLTALMNQRGDDTIRFVVTGDSQKSIDELYDLVNSVNGLQNIDFLILAGDITQKSTVKEYKWAQRELARLNVPYVTVVGNHDLERNGEQLFKTMFGPLNYSFNYGNTKFICLNSNSIVYNYDGTIPNMNWLNSEIRATSDVENIVVVAHIPPWHPAFDPQLEAVYASTLSNNRKTLLSVHAHINWLSYDRPYRDGVDYMVAPSIIQDPTTPSGKSYIVSTIVDTEHRYEAINY